MCKVIPLPKRNEDRLTTPRQLHILATLSVAPEAKFAPVQVQKILFLIDQNIADALGGKQFDFAAYDYGPFDKTIYKDLSELSKLGFVEIEDGDDRALVRKYSLTVNGLKVGQEKLHKLPSNAQSYINQVVPWAKSLSFSQLVGAIYKAYPDMRANSIFRQ
jgi:uncharacterized protein